MSGPDGCVHVWVSPTFDFFTGRKIIVGETWIMWKRD
jgi:hypothetical protein